MLFYEFTETDGKGQLVNYGVGIVNSAEAGWLYESLAEWGVFAEPCFMARVCDKDCTTGE